MIKLDEKKIRKGKAVGLPYVGSKKKISKKIVEIIKQNFGTDKTVYDVFGGGGAITAELMINGIDVVYNDFDSDVVNILESVSKNEESYIKSLIVSRDKFLQIRGKKCRSSLEEFILLLNSFGNNRRSYIYDKKTADYRFKMAKEIVDKEKDFETYKRTETYKSFKSPVRLQQLERLNQVLLLKKHMSGRNVVTKNLDYKCFSNVKNAVIYLDPPYENTEQEAYRKTIDYYEFYNWCVYMSKNNIVLLSSYEVSDDRFECVYEFKNARSTMAGGVTDKRTEKLFMVK